MTDQSHAAPRHLYRNQLGFSPRVHLIAAWKVFEVEELIRDRLFCHRLGDYVPYSLEEHPETVKNDLSIKVSLQTRLRHTRVVPKERHADNAIALFCASHVLFGCLFGLCRRKSFRVFRDQIGALTSQAAMNWQSRKTAHCVGRDGYCANAETATSRRLAVSVSVAFRLSRNTLGLTLCAREQRHVAKPCLLYTGHLHVFISASLGLLPCH